MRRRLGTTLEMLALEEEEVEDDDEDEMETTSESSAGSPRRRGTTMRCVSCEERYASREAGTCKECYDEANDTEEDLKRQIDDLNSKISFLRLAAPPFSDVVLVASDDSDDSPLPIPAHKAVLVSRSPVFRAMLENEMEESRSGTIKIKDVSREALQAFVNYMYTAEAHLDDDRTAYDLLVVAEKYEVKHLKAYCERFLVSNLSWDNSVLSYGFAHQHNAKQLLEAALSLITENMDKLTKREEYLELKLKDPRLVVEIYEAYLSKQVNIAAHKDSSPKT